MAEREESESTRVVQVVSAPRPAVYRALLDADLVAERMVPTGMTSHVHAFEPREGGFFRISLTYDEPTGPGKTGAGDEGAGKSFIGRSEKPTIRRRRGCVDPPSRMAVPRSAT